MPSTVISSMSYDVEAKLLTINFVTGRVYHYFDVPADVFQSLKTSGSKGTYFNLHIRNKYAYKELH
jgi:hypothetical protein